MTYSLKLRTYQSINRNLPPFVSANGDAKADRRCDELDLRLASLQSVSAELAIAQTVFETLLAQMLAQICSSQAWFDRRYRVELIYEIRNTYCCFAEILDT